MELQEILINGVIVLATSVIVVLLNNFFWKRRLREPFREEIFRKRLSVYEQILAKIGKMNLGRGKRTEKEINEFIEFLDEITYSNLLFISHEMHTELEAYMVSLMDFIEKKDWEFEESENIIFRIAFKELGIGTLMREKELDKIFGKRRSFESSWDEYLKQMGISEERDASQGKENSR